MQGNAVILPNQRPGKRRLRLFVCTFVVCCSAGMAYTYLRPAVYVSRATLLISERTTSSGRRATNDGARKSIISLLRDVAVPRHVAVQRHFASHPSVISDVFDRFAEQFESRELRRPDGTVPDFAEVDEMLSAHAVPETDFLELRAEGGQPAELTFLVETWIDLFLAGQTAAERKMTESTSTAIHKQLSELEGRVEEKRRELAAFREAHEIASMQREENRSLARLNGLTRSLSTAEEAEAAATARVDAVKAALNEGDPARSEKTDQLLVEMETRAADAQEWLHEQESIYTAAYLAKNRDVVKTKQFLEFLAGAIQARRAELEKRELSNARFEMAAAQKRVANIRGGLAEHQQKVAEFTTRFAEHEALSEDLLQLEALHRQLRERVVQTEVMREALPPEISVAQNASVPLRPIRPNYNRDALISLAGSLLCGLAAVVIDWMVTRPPRQSTQLQTLETRTVYYPLLGSQTAAGHAVQAIGDMADSATGSRSTRALEHRPSRELSPDEVTALLDASETTTRSLLGLLLSGLSIDELRALNWSDIDLATDSVRVSGADTRSVTIAPAVVKYLEVYAAARGATEGYLWRNANSQPLTGDAIHSLVVSMAHMAEIKDATRVDAETIRHTYVAFLARQGLTPDELVKIVGRIPEQTLQEYELLQVPGLRVAAADVSLFYTSLADPQPV